VDENKNNQDPFESIEVICHKCGAVNLVHLISSMFFCKSCGGTNAGPAAQNLVKPGMRSDPRIARRM